LHWLLRRRGIENQLRIGVRVEGDGLAAHAWIEIAGEPINERPGVCASFSVLEPREFSLAASNLRGTTR
jgi:hypothetical protein